MILKASLACGPSPVFRGAGDGQVLTMGSRISTRLPRNRLAGFFLNTLAGIVSRLASLAPSEWFQVAPGIL